MKKIVVAMFMVSLVCPGLAFAQQSDWETFQQHIQQERITFNNQIRQEREAFLKSHPDVVSWLEAQSKANLLRAQQQHEARLLRRKGINPASVPAMKAPAAVIPAPEPAVVKPVEKRVAEPLGPPVQVNGQMGQ